MSQTVPSDETFSSQYPVLEEDPLVPLFLRHLSGECIMYVDRKYSTKAVGRFGAPCLRLILSLNACFKFEQFLSLPKTIIGAILSYCSVKTIAAFSCTFRGATSLVKECKVYYLYCCRQMPTVVFLDDVNKDNENVWKKLISLKDKHFDDDRDHIQPSWLSSLLE